MSDNKNIFKKHFESGMIVRNFNSFQRTHPTLLKCILAAMKEVEENKKQLSIKAIDFAEWLVDNCWIKNSNGLWYFESDADIDEGITTIQLFELFEKRPILTSDETGNILIEMPKEVQNLITSKAHKYWAEIQSIAMVGGCKMCITHLYEEKEAEKYFAGERAKQKIAELELQIEQLKK